MEKKEDFSIISAIDRLEEAHWNLHQIEEHYHEADIMRFSINSFLRVIKEVPQILQMELQNIAGFSKWFRERKSITISDSLMSDLYKKRDIVVHRTMLVPKSQATLGITRRNGKIKLGFGIELDPLQDSDILIIKFLKINIKEHGKNDIFGFLEDDDETLPCVKRIWKIEPYETEVLDLLVNAWNLTAKLIEDTIIFLGGNIEEYYLKLGCIHTGSNVNIRAYDRKWLKDIEKDIESGEEDYKLIAKLKYLREKAMYR
ncbi:hypothetical protein ACIQYL_25080 [Lysinibacillus xylanilyticus]|uniref:hypothetical protein n=1 Tax=Lysinibacillus xylanilyticus TaxID=582475 RepID=UPI0037F818C5